MDSNITSVKQYMKIKFVTCDQVNRNKKQNNSTYHDLHNATMRHQFDLLNKQKN